MKNIMIRNMKTDTCYQNEIKKIAKQMLNKKNSIREWKKILSTNFFH